MATLTKPVYRLDENKKEQFVGILLLSYIIHRGGQLPLLMNGDFKVLDGVVTKMVGKGYLQISGSQFLPTQKGEEVIKTFMKRYHEYLKVYDIYCAVDLDAGEFAFERFFDIEDKEQWKAYLNENRFEDVRVAVAEFKKLDPLEIVFMSFINEDRFDFQTKGWQFDVYSGLAWTEIEKICNSALSVADLTVEFPEVVVNLIEKGTDVAIFLMREEDRLKQEEAERRAKFEALQKENQQQNEQIEEVVEVTEYDVDYYYQPYTYYEVYRDPIYISPVWTLPLLLLI